MRQEDQSNTRGLPAAQGLYDPRFEHDACGIGFVSHIKGHKSHDIITKGIQLLINLTHRGACGCDPETGDGAGVLIQIPHKFFVRECAKLGFTLPPAGEYGVGMTFLPVEPHARLQVEGILERIAREEGLTVLGWRDTPINGAAIGRVARVSQPYIEQIFLGRGRGVSEEDLERKLYVVRKRAETEVAASDLAEKSFFYVPSLSARTIVYKGLLLAPQIANFYPELSDPEVVSALCLVHQRFSTNTFPTWQLAHPFRAIAHNGEINTLRGNVNWMHARQSILASPLFGDDIKKLFPVIQPNGSDSQAFDNALELLVMSGRGIAHAMAMLIPEAWSKNPHMNPQKRAFYEYHASLMEPWDGPAAIAFTDGRSIGATLDRNGLRPARYLVTHDDMIVMASETGVLPVKPEEVKQKGRLQPGKMLLVDTVEGRIVADRELKARLYGRNPYQLWIKENQITLDSLADPPREITDDPATLLRRQRAFGYTDEDVRMVLSPMAITGEEPIGSMGTDTPLACLSDKPQPLFNYFKQLFAQVTNPPIDPIREEMVMSLISYIGTERNILAETPAHCHTLKLEQPILSNRDLEKLRRVSQGDFLASTLPTLFLVEDGVKGLERGLTQLCRHASQAIASGYTLLILSDRGMDAEYAPIPSLLALTAVHNHLVREETRTQVALIIESGEPREVMHFALLIGYGASAINPYLALETVGPDGAPKLVKAVNKGLLKTFSKMGISTLQSYRGAQVFEAIGLSKNLVDRYFTGTASRIEGVDLDVLAKEAIAKHQHAFHPVTDFDTELAVGGNYHFRARGEYHLYNPQTIAKLQHAVRQENPKTFQEYTDLIDNQNRQLCTLRGLLNIKSSPEPVPIDEVEPAAEIVKRFATGAMSFGSISKEAHETLAIAMNRIGGRSNTGEGGEDEERLLDNRRSAIKQVASGRFGVTTNYLVNADELQIKMAQGAKPGEGGQLPGHKVDETIARVRHSTPGVGLISPPPHHDIYSIEDLAQLIYDLKNVNPKARISVKLVAEVGVGTVAAGVAKAHADLVLISGDSGGTGASPLSSIKHAGAPWELGLAETHQVLVLNDLRGRIRVQTDGKLQTGRDVTIAALLGAEEFGFSTAPLIAMGCIMMRKCHLNTCPVGIATQDPALRAKFQGSPEHVINFFFFIAEQVRQYMAKLGFRTFDEMVGRVDMLDARHASDHWKAKGLDLDAILYNPQMPSRIARRCVQKQDHGLEQALDYKLIDHAKEALEHGTRVEFKLPIRNVHRTVGAMLSGEIARRYGAAGLPDNTIHFQFAGSAGQSFGAFLARGVTLELDGDANDYVGKGLSGGRLMVYPPRTSTFQPEENILIGNVALYGATSGEAFFNGMGGERFAVRNSGASAVVEGLGDHGCEYMTGGTVVVLGKCGRNFAAGMSGGVAFVLDERGDFAERRCNTGSVDLDPLTKEDIALLQSMIAKHAEATGSPRARWILEAWESMLPKFIKVFPREYKKVLEQRRARAAAAMVAPPQGAMAAEVAPMGKVTGFMEYTRELPKRRDPVERIKDWFEIYQPYPHENVRTQGARCMDCGVPFCHTGCPLTNLIPDWNDLVYRGNWREAVRQLHATNNFPEFTGRICPAPCEASCVLGINEPAVTIKQIEKTIIDHAFQEGWIRPESPEERTGKRVAVVGSGPAGLAAAQQLARAGHDVTVFEKADRIGGLLRYGIPNFKMEKHLIDRRLEQMRKEGVRFETNAHVGGNVPVEDLHKHYDAILLSGGAEQGRNLNVPGRELQGIHFAMEFLPQQNRICEGDTVEKQILATGKHVIIIGGGDTGADCLGTSHRQGAASVHQFELLPKPPDTRASSTPWPLWPMQLRTESSHEEGGIREWSVSTVKFTGDEQGRVKQLHGIRVGGPPKFEALPGTEFAISADLVLLAMGFTGPVRNGMIEQLGVSLDARGNVATGDDHMSSVPGVFAAGDMRRGQSLVVWAIAEGRKAARSIDLFLMGQTQLP